MGGLFDWVSDLIGGVIGLPFFWLDKIFGTTIFTSLIEDIMGFLGFEDEDIYETDVISVRVFDEDLYNKVQQDLHLEYMSKGYGAIDYSTNFAKTGDNQFGRYFRAGKWDYLDYLPEAQITASNIDRNGIENVLKQIESTDVFIINIVNRTPTDEMWSKFQLQELYNYDIGSDSLQYTDNMWYKYDSTSYQTSNNTLNISLVTIPVIDSITYRSTTITVTSIDETTDNKNTLITNDILYSDDATGNVLYNTSTIESNVDEVVPKGSVSDSFSQELITNEDIIIPDNTIIINVPYHANVRYYNVEYTRTDIGRLKYWLYNPASNLYPISSPNTRTSNFEMFPITMMRNTGTNINQYNNTSKPASITEKRYKQTQKVLKSVGVDVDDLIEGFSENPDIAKIQDAFFLLGISPSDTHPIISRVLYEMFDAIYDTSPFVDINTNYSMAVKENPYNSAIVWNTGDVGVYNGVIYSGALVGDCKHTIRKFNTTTTQTRITTVTRLYENNKPIKDDTLMRVVVRVEKAVILDGVVDHTETISMATYTRPHKYRHTIQGGSVLITYYNPGVTITEIDRVETIEDGMRIQKQLTSNTYRNIDIHNFHAVYIIRGDGFSSGKDLPIDNPNLIIPLAVPVVARLTLMEKTALLGRAVHMTFFAVQHTHLEWYETEHFTSVLQTTMIVIMIVITVYVTVVTWGTGTGPTLTAFAAVMAALETIAVAVAVQLALKLIAKFVDDPALKAALSMAVMAIGIMYGTGFDFSAISGLTALQLGAACINAVNMYVGDVINEDMQDFTNEISDFNTKYEQRSSQQEEILKGQTSGLTSFDMVDLSTNIDMFNSTGKTNKSASASLLSPNQFFYLATNQAAYNYDLMYSGLYDNTVHDFVSNKLQLGIPGA